MARTIDEIMTEMLAAKASEPALNQLNSTSISAIWRCIFYVVAVAIWTLEGLFDLFKKEVDSSLSNKKPHRLKWYRDKTLAFQKDYLLPEDSDVYDVVDENAKIVKYAAAVEPSDSSKLLIKIAGDDGLRDKLPDEEAIQIYAYLQTIKDAGVRIELINQSPDHYKCEIDIYYNAMLLKADVEAAVRNAIIVYIENLDFNGEYSNMYLIDVIQSVAGVVIAEMISSSSKPSVGDIGFIAINAKKIPDAGYFRAYENDDIILNLKAYELAQD